MLTLNKLVLNCLCILAFGLSNSGSFGDQCYVAMATLACEIHAKNDILCCVGKKEVW